MTDCIIVDYSLKNFTCFLKILQKRVKITASLRICYIKFYFATNIKLYLMKGDCNIKL